MGAAPLLVNGSGLISPADIAGADLNVPVNPPKSGES
jgi:hypothetical protein